MKKCNVCHIEKGLDEFYRDALSDDGRNSTCKPCSRQRSKAWKEQNPEKVKEQARRGNARARANPRPPAMEGVKMCRVCGEDKPVTEFYAYGGAPDGRGYTCKPCSRERSKRWNTENREQFNANQRKSWQARADGINEYRRKRAATDPEYQDRLAAERRRYWERHRERLLAEAKKWRQSPEGQAYYKQYHEADRPRARLRHVLRTYNLSVDDYQALIAETKGRCPICKREGQEWAVDHDHSCCPSKESCGKCVRGLLCRQCNRGLGHFDDDPVRLAAAARYLKKKLKS